MTDGVLRMPRLSDSMEEAVVVRWLKAVGEPFSRGEPLVEVETDKATVVYEAEAAGTLGQILVAEGETALLGDPIALLDGATAPVGASSAPAAPPTAARESAPAPVPPPAAAAPSSNGGNGSSRGRVRATPVARRTAVELGVSLDALAGTGPGGRIRRLDVERAAAATPPAPALEVAAAAAVAAQAAIGLKGAEEIVRLSGTRATIARRMEASRAEIPSFEVAMAVDLGLVLELRRDAVGVEQIPSVNDFIVRAVALVLREQPLFNSSYVDGRRVQHGRVNVGVAVATDHSLLVPAVLDADAKGLAAIAAETRDLAARARARQLGLDELTSSTFTVSNLGMFGASSFTAIINQPQVAILAVGAAERRPVETPAGPAFRDIATLTLTSDHRVIYGADAAQFLGRVRELLEHPLALVL